MLSLKENPSDMEEILDDTVSPEELEVSFLNFIILVCD